MKVLPAVTYRLEYALMQHRRGVLRGRESEYMHR